MIDGRLALWSVSVCAGSAALVCPIWRSSKQKRATYEITLEACSCSAWRKKGSVERQLLASLAQ